MIANRRQYRITKAQLERFQHTLAALQEERPDRRGVHPALAQAETEGIRSQIQDLRQQIAEYEQLAAGEKQILELDSFAQLPEALVKARIAAGLTQRELAAKLGVKEQQIQRYEATDYAAASLSRIYRVIDALGVGVRKQVFLPSVKKSLQVILSRLRSLGIDRNLVMKRFISRPRAAAIQQASCGREADWGGAAIDIASNVSRVFGWVPSSLVAGGPLVVSRQPLGAARFKVASNTERSRLMAYTVYAHYLAMVLLEATNDMPQTRLATDAAELRHQVIARCGAVDLPSVLRFVWEGGLPVLPLQDPGAFQGACWRVAGRNVIVLKQRTSSQSRWLYDLLHELWHAAEGPDEEEGAHVDVDEGARDTEDAEEEANRFAGDVLLDGRAEDLVQQCVDEAKGGVSYLKSALPRVARREGVSVAALANYMAFRLSLQDINWWGTAANLQERGEHPFIIARDILMERVDLGRLNRADADLLMCALANPGEEL